MLNHRSAALLVALSFLASSSAFAASASAGITVMYNGERVVLHDVEMGMWFTKPIQEVARKGIMQGYRNAQGEPTGEFGPSKPVTRAEFLKMVAVMMVNRYDFDRIDVIKGDKWYNFYRTIVKGVDKDLAEVMPIDDASLQKPILRHEAAGLIHLGLGNHNLPPNWDTYPLFEDVAKTTPNAYAIAELRGYNALTGDGKTGNFNPYRTLNRAEAAKILVATAEGYQVPLGMADK